MAIQDNTGQGSTGHDRTRQDSTAPETTMEKPGVQTSYMLRVRYVEGQCIILKASYIRSVYCTTHESITKMQENIHTPKTQFSKRSLTA